MAETQELPGFPAGEQSPEPVDGATQAPAAGRGRSRNRTLPVLAGVAVLSLLAGFGLSRLVVNPADAAARTAPPAAGLIAVPVEHRELSNDVTIRGDVLFDGAAEVRVETAEMATRAVVTGMVPEAGTELDAGDVILEVAGRPVIVLPGGLPTYRTLRMGVSGPDVLQLKEALSAMGIPVGDVTSDVFDTATANAVAELYRRAGFPVPPVSETVAAEQTAADQRVRHAQEALDGAQRALSDLRSGPDPVAVASANQAVNAAERQYGIAHAAFEDLRKGCQTGERFDCGSADFARAQAMIDDAADAVHVARAGRAQLDVAPDTAAARAAVTAAQEALTEAQAARRTANEAALPHLPASEVVFLETLPRRVDSVNVRRGETLSGNAVMSVSGAELKVTASAVAADVALLEVGAVGFIEVGDSTIEVTVTEIGATDASSGRATVTLTPGELTNEQVVSLRGTNVRVTIPVSSTGGAVLTVPLAALTAGPAGESRVEVKEADGSTSLVRVTTGLAAGGHVEVTGVDRDLAVGDLVVIGAGGTGSGGDAGTPEESDA